MNCALIFSSTLPLVKMVWNDLIYHLATISSCSLICKIITVSEWQLQQVLNWKLLWHRKYTLSQAWQALKRVHRRAQPNDGFAKILLELDQKLHGKVSMEWHQRKPVMKVCPICGNNAGLSSSSLKLHLQKSHRKLSSGSVDSAMTMEIQKALTALKISRGGSVSPKPRKSHSTIEA